MTVSATDFLKTAFGLLTMSAPFEDAEHIIGHGDQPARDGAEDGRPAEALGHRRA